MTINERQQEIIDEFTEIEDWLDRYAQIIDLGNDLPPIDERLKTPDHLIEGCQSRVWLDATLDERGHLHYVADSDAIIVKGIISMLISVLNDQTPDDILACDLHFINAIGLGPQGMGGKFSVMGVNIENTARHPSTIGVAVNVGCWSHRRGHIVVDKDLNVTCDTHSTWKFNG